MTRKDFELVAWSLKRTGIRTKNWQAVGVIARGLAMDFGLAHTNFNPAKFYNACGLDSHGRVLP